MKQASYVGPGNIVVGEGVLPGTRPGPDQVSIAVAYTGICGTDLHIYHGDMEQRVHPGSVLGHEMSGRIAAVGSGAGGKWSVGDPVTVMPLEWCGRCPACRSGYQHICHNLSFIGIDAPGSMQERWTVPAATLVRLPGSIDLKVAALIEPTAVAVHDVRRAGVKEGDRVLVVGGGPVGALIALVATQAGADVFVLETDEYRRSIASNLRLAVADPITANVAAYIEDWTSGTGADIAFEVSGAPQGLASAVANLSVRGRLCMVAIHTSEPPVDMHRVFWRELTIIGARLYERSDFETAVQLVADASFDVNALISKVYPLANAPDAFVTLGEANGVMKVLVDCQVGD